MREILGNMQNENNLSPQDLKKEAERIDSNIQTSK
jgi:hypothetical protein